MSAMTFQELLQRRDSLLDQRELIDALVQYLRTCPHTVDLVGLGVCKPEFTLEDLRVPERCRNDAIMAVLEKLLHFGADIQNELSQIESMKVGGSSGRKKKLG